MAGFSSYFEGKVINTLRGTPTTIATIWVSLHTATVGDSATGTEVSSALGYARKPVVLTAPVLEATGTTCSNSCQLDFGPCAGTAWGTVTSWGLWDNSSAGNLLLHGDFSVSRNCQLSDPFTILINTLIIEVR